MTKYVITEYPGQQFLVTLIAKNGHIMIQSSGRNSLFDSYDIILKLQSSSTMFENYLEHHGGDGWHYFTIVGDDGESLGTSKRYKTKAHMMNAKHVVYAVGSTEMIIEKRL